MADDANLTKVNDFVILTESTCDMPQEMADALGIAILPIRVMVEEREYAHYLDGRELGFHDFYEKLRAGISAKTAAANTEEFIAQVEPALAAGRDVLYLGFSSALSGTFGVGAMAAEQLKEKYPERKIYAVDTLCASFGQGLFVYLAAQQKLQGKDIDAVKAYVEEIRPQLCHWFTVDDLQHLKRGGRVSAAAAAFGTMLNIKPILHVDDEGRLIPVSKVQGRLASVKMLAKKCRKPQSILRNRLCLSAMEIAKRMRRSSHQLFAKRLVQKRSSLTLSARLSVRIPARARWHYSS